MTDIKSPLPKHPSHNGSGNATAAYQSQGTNTNASGNSSNGNDNGNDNDFLSPKHLNSSGNSNDNGSELDFIKPARTPEFRELESPGAYGANYVTGSAPLQEYSSGSRSYGSSNDNDQYYYRAKDNGKSDSGGKSDPEERDAVHVGNDNAAAAAAAAGGGAGNALEGDAIRPELGLNRRSTSCYANALQRRGSYEESKGGQTASEAAAKAGARDQEQEQEQGRGKDKHRRELHGGTANSAPSAAALDIDAPRSSQMLQELKKDLQKSLFDGTGEGEHRHKAHWWHHARDRERGSNSNSNSSSEKTHKRHSDPHQRDSQDRRNADEENSTGGYDSRDDRSEILAGEGFHPAKKRDGSAAGDGGGGDESSAGVSAGASTLWPGCLPGLRQEELRDPRVRDRGGFSHEEYKKRQNDHYK